MKALFLLVAGILSHVNPFVGTDFHGHTFPGATYPFGMVQLSPDTRPKPGDWDGCSGYHYSDTLIYGFSHTHLSGTGCDDLCDILLLPGTQPSQFSHEREKASPGYYEVFLEKPQVQVRLAVGKRCGMHEYTFPSGTSPIITLNLDHRDVVLEASIDVAGNTVSGLRRSRSWSMSQDVYYYIEFSSSIDKYEIDGNIAKLQFKSSRKNIITARVGISSVSVENAKSNLMSEYPKDINSLKKDTEKAWSAFLSKLKCPDDANPDIFYTALYHCAIHPSLYSDVNGEYRGMDRKVHKTDGWERYTIFSLWDTFRGLHPLLTKIEPEKTLDFLKSFLSVYAECGKLPVWELYGYETNCMIGYNSAPVIADAIAHGITDFDMEAALKALVASSNNPYLGLDSFRKNGFVRADDEHESVSKTLEYAFDDWCVAQVAKYLGHNDIYEKYMESAQYWRNVFDPQTGFMRARLNGRWVTPFDPREVNNHFTEANSWQYSFFVPQDIKGLIDALGGKEAFCERLDRLFTEESATTGRTQVDITGQIGQYAHGNEPSHHIAYLYELAGQPEKSKKIVSQIMNTLYSSAPDGLCGNEDCGQMSAWYILSALGEYPVTPGLSEIGVLTEMKQTIVVNPSFEMENDIFKDSLTISVGTIQEGCKAYYRIGNDEFREYTKPFTVYTTSTMEAYTESPDGKKSFTTKCGVHKINDDMTIRILSRYNKQYNAGGDQGLIDNVRGTINWRTGSWQGYQGTDFTAIVDLLEVKELHSVGAGFLQDARSWIWMPRYMEVYTSEDGINYKLAGRKQNTVGEQDYEVQIWNCECEVETKARYIKVFARNFGTIPEWHPGEGGEGFIFIDEIWYK